VSFSEGVCASCHQDATHHYKPSQWQTSAHAQRDLVSNATFESRGTTAAHCGRCHSAQGFAAYSAQLAKGDAGLLHKPDGTAADEAYLRGLGLQTSTVEAITCAACHDPHDASNPSQLRLGGNLKALPNGLTNIVRRGQGRHLHGLPQHPQRGTRRLRRRGHRLLGPAHPIADRRALRVQCVLHAASQSIPAPIGDRHLRRLPRGHTHGHREGRGHDRQPQLRDRRHHLRLLPLVVDQRRGVVGSQRRATWRTGTAIGTKALAIIMPCTLAANTLSVRAYRQATDQYSSAAATTADILLAAAPTAVVLRSAIHGTTSFTLTLAAPVSVAWVATTSAPAITETLSQIDCQISGITITGQTCAARAARHDGRAGARHRDEFRWPRRAGTCNCSATTDREACTILTSSKT
jgi:hypothetical protein